MYNISHDDVSLIITTISIILGCVISVASYLISTPIPQLMGGSIKQSNDSISILESLDDLIKLKKDFGKKLIFIYFLVFLLIIFVLFFLVFFIDSIFLPIITFVGISFMLFGYCSYKVTQIIKINTFISEKSRNILTEHFIQDSENEEEKSTKKAVIKK